MGTPCGQRQGGFHGVEDFRDEFVLFVEREVEDEFVVDLEQHLRLVRFFPQQGVDADHGEFDHVGGGALDGGVDGGALGVAAEVLVAGVEVGEIAAAAGEGFDVTGLAGLVRRCGP